MDEVRGGALRQQVQVGKGLPYLRNMGVRGADDGVALLARKIFLIQLLQGGGQLALRAA
nr:hypothetical protein [Glutamicibacter sp. HZAU]